MTTPASNGKLCTRLEDMCVGDYIRCEYIAEKENVAGIFQNLGKESSLNEIPFAGKSMRTEYNISSVSNGYFYFIKVDKGLLVADRQVQANISATAINNASYLNGKNIPNLGLIRCLSRGEFLRYISNSSLENNIIPADYNVWHGAIDKNGNSSEWAYPYAEINQDKKDDSVATSLFLSGLMDGVGVHYIMPTWGCQMPLYVPAYVNNEKSTMSWGSIVRHICFRPALEFIDNDKSKLIWY